MKNSIITIAAALMLISTTAFAGKKHPSRDNPAEATFQKTFVGASDVKWSEGKETIAASFILNDSRVVAFFSYDGELLGTARKVLFNQLPLAVVREINSRYGSAPIADITEYSRNEDTFYDMVVDRPEKQLKVRVTALGDLSVEGKIKK